MKRRTVRVDNAQTVVLDEADRMLDMGFIHDVTRLLDRMSKRRHLGLFSATISREVMDIAWVYQRDAVEVTVREDEKNKPDIKQFRMDWQLGGEGWIPSKRSWTRRASSAACAFAIPRR